MDCKIKVSKVFNNNPEGRRLTGRPKTDGGALYKQILIDAIKNWNGWSRNKADCEMSVNEAMVRIGL
jgi:hypothetical protein